MLVILYVGGLAAVIVAVILVSRRPHGGAGNQAHPGDGDTD